MPPALSGISRLAGSSLLRLQTDDRLLALTRDGHEAAFAAIVDRYRPELCRYARRLVGDDRAEDAVQQALVSAHAAMLSTNTPLQLRAWLHRITHNAAISTLRRDRCAEAPFDDQVEAGGADAADDAMGRERLRAALTAVAALPEPQRDALLLQAVDGRSHAEIAAALDVTPGAARQHVHRARASVRAAVTAVTPYGILVKLATVGSATAGFGGAELAGVGGAGVGATALVTKVGVGVLAAGAIAGGTATTVHHHGRSHHGQTRSVEARSVEARTTPRAARTAAHTVSAIAIAKDSGHGRGRSGSDDGRGGKGSGRSGSDDGRGGKSSGRSGSDDGGGGGKGSSHGGSDNNGDGSSRSGSDDGGGGRGKRSSHSSSDDGRGKGPGHGGSDD